MRDVGQRLRRLLYVVPYVAKHSEGVRVEDLADMLHISRDHMLKDIDMLTISDKIIVVEDIIS